MVRLLIVRHGETEVNARRGLHGKSPAILTHKGLLQAQALKKCLAKEKIDAIYCSTQPRAVQTAEEIASAHKRIKIIQDPALDERDFGEFEGLTIEEIVERFPEYGHKALAQQLELKPPGGESKLQMAERAKPLLEKLVEKHSEQTILIVAHGGINKILIGLLTGMPLEETHLLKQHNVCLNEVTVAQIGKAELKKLNDTRHLEPLRDTLDNEI